MRGRLILTVILFIMVFASPSWAEVTCGATIGPSEVVTLTEDLICPGGNFETPALIVEAASILNLGGHMLDCENAFKDGIRMNGGGSIVQNGTVSRCRIAGVRVGGDGGHLVTNVTATMTQFGFVISSQKNELKNNRSTNNSALGYILDSEANHNTLKENLARGNGRDGFFTNPGASDNTFTKNQSISNTQRGFFIQGNRNYLTNNLAKDNDEGPNDEDSEDNGFEISGNGNQVLSNTSIRNGNDGFQFLNGSGNTVLGNTAKKNGRNGIRLRNSAINSQVVGNTARRNDEADLVDVNLNCDNNEWIGNRFGTADPADCIQ